MKNVFGLSSRLVLSTLLGLSLTAWLSLGPANAQGKKKDAKTGNAKMDHKMSDSHMMNDHMMKDMDEDDVLPVAPSYPMAAPGSLHLMHWEDFQMERMHHGAAMDKKMDKMHDKMASGGMMHEDVDEALPVAPSYPMSAPGSLHLMHWENIEMERMHHGAAMDKKMDKMHDKMASDTMMHENEEDVLPVAPSYPMAAPGSLDMMHWEDFRMMKMHHGAAMDKKMDNMKMKSDKMKSDKMKK